MYIKNVFFFIFWFFVFLAIKCHNFLCFLLVFFLYYFVFSNGVSGNLFLQLAMKLS